MKYYCLILMRCPLCGAEGYRHPRFVPHPEPCYKGEEVRLPEVCCAVPTIDPNPDVYTYLGLCRGELETVPGFNHDLTLHNFEVDMETVTDGKVKGHRRVSSLHEVRQIEADSLKRHANGEGQPMVFRDLSQNKSNRSVNTLTGTPYEKGRAMPKDEAVRRARTHAGQIKATRVSADQAGR